MTSGCINLVVSDRLAAGIGISNDVALYLYHLMPAVQHAAIPLPHLAVGLSPRATVPVPPRVRDATQLNTHTHTSVLWLIVEMGIEPNPNRIKNRILERTEPNLN